MQGLNCMRGLETVIRPPVVEADNAVVQQLQIQISANLIHHGNHVSCFVPQFVQILNRNHDALLLFFFIEIHAREIR